VPDLAFTRQRRLLSKADYKRVFDNAIKLSTPVFTILFRRNQLEYSRLGLAIAKKQLPKAVQRNRVKRLVRESFRLHMHTIEGLDFVVMARKGIIKLDNAVVATQLKGLWGKVEQAEKRARRKSEHTR
tara:strand:- start:2733 stop:3116 length:384 start_codon:yes stop_codon:yes gene_type:complete